MRHIAKVQGHTDVKRLMIHECDDGVFLFLFEIEDDGACSFDLWFECLEDALKIAEDTYGVKWDQWQQIPDPPEYCQQDWIAPARIPGRESGTPEWGKLDVLKDGKWVRIIG